MPQSAVPYAIAILVTLVMLRMKPPMRLKGCLTALFLTFVFLSPRDEATGRMSGPSPELSLIIAVMVGVAFFTQRPTWRVGS